MRARGKNTGRRGKRQRKSVDRVARKDKKRLQAKQDEKDECERLLALILPKIKRLCRKSTVGLICERGALPDYYRRVVYYSVEGYQYGFPVDARIELVGEVTPWSDLPSCGLWVRRNLKWEVVNRKPAMVIIAEYAAGLHD